MKSKISAILKKEIRESFRDKKSLSMMLIIPLMIPLLVLGMSFLFEGQLNKDISEYNKIGFAYELSDIEREILKDCNIDFVEDSEEKLQEKFTQGSIYLFVTKNENNYIMNGNDSENSTYALNLAESYFESWKSYLQSEILSDNSIDPDSIINVITVEQNIDSEENFFSSYITNYAFLFIIMAITVSATYPATDTTAGEKERGTLETLLTFPVKSKDIIVGKFLGVSLSSIITGIISLILAIISLILANDMFTIYSGISIVPSLETIACALLIVIIYSFFISGICIAIASKSKTFKEAQSALTPVTFVSFFPGMIAFMLNIQNTALLSIIPFLNFSMVFNDIAIGEINYINLFLVIISTIIYIVLVLKVIIWQYRSEKVLF